jgi:hypothetical protein
MPIKMNCAFSSRKEFFTMQLLFILLVLASPSGFASTYRFPILQKTLGGLDKRDGVVKTKN